LIKTNLGNSMTRTTLQTADTLLSVIIPAYNVAAFVDACLESALYQPRAEEIQFILVDDASTDATLDRIRAVQRTERGRNIKVVVHEKNRGLSATRNEGIRHATSPYIGFLDSDDIWAENFSAAIMPVLDQGAADIVEFNVGITDSNGRIIDHMELIDRHSTGLRTSDSGALMEYARVFQNFPVARIYRRELWEGIEFPTGRVYEDCAVIPTIYTRARTMHRLSDELYLYRRHAGGITQTATPHTVRCLAACAEESLARYDGDSEHARYWLAVFHKCFSLACVQASRVETRAFPESMKIVEETASHYRAFTRQHTDNLPSLSFHTRIFANRHWFRTKRAIKRVLGLQGRPRFLRFLRFVP
jgi:glycosyltransferase involved in cell wall biosynthesis